jgi:hypothetical protein
MSNFNRSINITIGTTRFDSDNFYIEFDVEKSDKENLNTCDLILYNLKRETRENIQQDQTVILNAGYQNDIGAIFIGGVQNVITERQDTDFVTTISCIDGKVVSNVPINKTYIPGSSSTQIINDLIKLSGLEANVVRIAQEIIYSNGKVVYGNLIEELGKIVTETRSKFYIKNNIITITLQNEGVVVANVVNSNTGLIETPSKLTDDSETVDLYLVKSLLNHNLDIDGIVQIQSQGLNGNFRITRVNHSGSLEDDFITEFEVAVNG